MSTEQYSIYVAQDQVNAIFTDAMARMYGLVALGIVTTGAAIWVGDMLGVGNVIFGFGWIGMLLMLGIMIGTLMGANAVVMRGNTGLGTVLYLAIHGIGGVLPVAYSDGLHYRHDWNGVRADGGYVRGDERGGNDDEAGPVEAGADADDRD